MPFYKVRPKGGRKVHVIQELSNTTPALCGLKSPTGWQHVSIPIQCALCLRETQVRIPPVESDAPETELQ